MNDPQLSAIIPTKLESMSKNELIKLAKKYIVLKKYAPSFKSFS
jgi:hypothetical protein